MELLHPNIPTFPLALSDDKYKTHESKFTFSGDSFTGTSLLLDVDLEGLGTFGLIRRGKPRDNEFNEHVEARV